MRKTTVALRDAFKTFTADQDKIRPPEETVRRLKERLSRLDLDILRETRRIDNGRLGIPVYFSRCGKDAAAATGTRKQMGKGATPAQSEASAVMELSERFSFFSFCNNPDHFLFSSRSRIAEAAMDFDDIARSVHDDSSELTVTKEIFDELPMRWAWAHDLSRDRQTLVPFDWFYMINEFNGPSAGNCVEEALVQGICEIVERHVSSLISLEKRTVPGVDPDSASDPAVVDMVGKYRSAGIRFHLSDFTLDMGIPSVGMLAWDPATFPQRSEIVWTAGTTPDPEKAMSRALTEVAQLAGDFNTGSNYVASGLPKFRTIEEAGYVHQAPKTIRISDLPDLSDDNIRVEVERLVETLTRRNMPVVVIDTSHPQLQVPAFYTIVPGAHFRERALGTSVGMFSAKLMAESFEPEAAVQALHRMDGSLPGKYYVQFYLGLVHLRRERPDAALPYFRKALTLDPNPQDIPSIHSYTAVCLKEMERFREALAVLQEAETLDAERTDIYNLMGFCHFRLGEHERAIAAFEKLLRLDPSSAIDYANIASNYRDMGNAAKAIEYYETALAIDPGIHFAAENLRRLKGGT